VLFVVICCDLFLSLSLFLTIWSKITVSCWLFRFFTVWQTIIPPSFPLFLPLMRGFTFRRQIIVKKFRLRVDKYQVDH